VIGYYVQLALLGLRRNVWLTSLIVIAVAVGIASSMTAYTLLHTLSGDPIPWKSSRIFSPEIDLIDPGFKLPGTRFGLVTYREAAAWIKAKQAERQTAIFGARATLTTEDPSLQPASTPVQANHSDFFGMFDVPFSSGASWSRADDESHARVVVLTQRLADQLYPDGKAVGQSVHLDREPFRVVGVIQDWRPWPSFYNLYTDPPQIHVDGGPQVFLPFETAFEIARRTAAVSMRFHGAFSCVSKPPAANSGFEGFVMASDCVWIQMWVELPTAADVNRYRQYLDGYASQLYGAGRPVKPPTELRGLRDWLVYNKVVPDEIRIASLVAFGFLVVCLVNAVALLLARFSRRNSELAIRRALGAPRSSLFAQCLIETAVIGAAGGLLGLLLTWFGLEAERATLPRALVRAAQLDVDLVAMTLGLAVLATVAAGIYPAWRSSRALSAYQLKAQ
jgi:putative ABC transport system permease protein